MELDLKIRVLFLDTKMLQLNNFNVVQKAARHSVAQIIVGIKQEDTITSQGAPAPLSYHCF